MPKKFHFIADFTFYAEDLDDAMGKIGEYYRALAELSGENEEPEAWFIGEVSLSPSPIE